MICAATAFKRRNMVILWVARKYNGHVPLGSTDSGRFPNRCYNPSILGGSVLFSRTQGKAATARTVADDWIASLPRDKREVFELVVRDWESYYGMLSVALDDAISQRAAGKLVSARQQVTVCSDLLARLAAKLVHSCHAADKRSRNIPSVPAVNPLNGEFFRGDTGRSAASRSAILHQVLFPERQRFHQKVKILWETTNRLAEEFVAAADEIADGISTSPVAAWEELESLHDDFTTCFRECEVLLKGFLRAVPADQLVAFQAQLAEMPVAIRHTRKKPVSKSKRASA